MTVNSINNMNVHNASDIHILNVIITSICMNTCYILNMCMTSVIYIYSVLTLILSGDESHHALRTSTSLGGTVAHGMFRVKTSGTNKVQSAHV